MRRALVESARRLPAVAGTDLRWRRHALERRLLRWAHPLRYLFFEVTRRCNLACAYCGSACSGRTDREELPIEEWIRVAREVAVDFDPRRVMVALTGGEPLLKIGILDLGRELARLGFRWGVVTNGLRLDGEVARSLTRAGLRSISLSLDAPAAVNDELRGQGAAVGVAAAVGHLHAAGYRGILEILSTVTSPAVPLLPQLRATIAELRVPRWRLIPVMPLGRAAARPDLVPGPAALRTVLEFVRDARADGQVPRPEFSEEGYVGDAFEGIVRTGLCDCRAGITIGGILADGRVGACPELGDAFVQGDIRRARFRDIWEDGYTVFRDRAWTRQGTCRTCAAYDRCQGGSLHLYTTPGAEIARCFHVMLRD